MIAAIYARKSTEQDGVVDEQKSVTRQIDHARHFAERKGWMIAEEHVYVDDGISGAEFANRPGFLRLMNALKPRAPFQVLIMSEESRLGREQIETSYALKMLSQAGVRTFFYMTDTERTLDSPTDKIMLALTSFASELERVKASQRVHDALTRKAKAGHVVGGRVFGYDNVDVFLPGVVDKDGRPKRSHVERRINAEEAAVIRRMFKLCAEGKGLRKIAHILNAERAVSPRPQQDRPATWAPSSVRNVLFNERYRGQVVWNRGKKRDTWGTVRPSKRPASDYIVHVAPDLRIVSDDLWQAAHDRLSATRETFLRASDGRLWGKPCIGTESKYLMAGMARCGTCGASMVVRSRSHGKRRVHLLVCGGYHQRGKTTCSNHLEARLDRVDEAVLRAFRRDLLDPDVIRTAIRQAVAAVQTPDRDPARRRPALVKALEQVEGELGRLTTAIALGGDTVTLVAAVRDREARRAAIRAELEAIDQPQARPMAPSRQMKLLDARLEDWTGLLMSKPAKARQLLRKLVAGRFTFTAELKKRRYRFTVTGTMSNLLSGIVDIAPFPKGVSSPTGFEPVFWP